jgi:hypothetical protein
MTMAFFGNGLYTCLKADTKITAGVTNNSVLVEIDTGKVYQLTGGTWLQTAGPGVHLVNETGVEPTATALDVPMYRKDIDANNNAIYVSKLENGTLIKVRIA